MTHYSDPAVALLIGWGLSGGAHGANRKNLNRLVNRSFEVCPQLGGCPAFPRSESSIKRIRILVAEQVRHLCDIDIRPVEILARQFLARPGVSTFSP